MASKNQDIWLWIGLGMVGYCAARAAHKQLIAVRTAARITKENKPQDILSQRTENALKLETLGQLTQSANQDIRSAVVRIIRERAVQDAVLDLILQDIAGKDIEKRDRSLTSLCYLCSSPISDIATHKARKPSYPLFKAIIDCLCSWLPAAQESESTPTNETFEYRSQPERDALKILSLVLPCDVTLGLQAGLISRWLAHCRFDNTDNSEARRKQAIREMLKWEYDDFEMCTILNTLVTDDQAREELINQGLADASAMENNTIDDVMEQIWIVTNRSAAEADGGPDSGPMMRRGRRVREESIEEQALRRRRREAMVLGQDGRAIEGDDIIERDDVSSDEDMEQPQVISEIVEAEAEDDQTWWDWRPWSVLRAGLVEEF